MNNLPKRLGIQAIALAMICLFGVAAQAQSNVRMQISTQESYVGMPVTLRIQVENGNRNSPPEFPEVDGLDIRSVGTPSQSSSVRIINGRRSESRSTVYSYQLTPRRAGTFEVPVISIGTSQGVQKTQAFGISATTSETGDLMFADVAGQKDKIYVGQPIDLTLGIWIKPFQDRKREITISAADMWRMIAQQSQFGAFEDALQKLAAEGKTIRGRTVLREDSEGIDRSYYLYEIVATVYPKRAGQIDVEDVQVVANYPTQLGQSRDPFESIFGDSTFGSMFDDEFFKHRAGSPFGRALTVTQSRPIVVTPDVAPIDVTPIPNAGRPKDYRGAVGQYQMVTQASPLKVKAGDPITLQIGIRGTGPMELVQAPPLAELPSLIADFKVSDEPLAGVVQDDIKVFSTSIRPRREGITQVPSIPFSFFDPSREEFITVHSEPIAIEVAKSEKLGLDSIVGTGGDRRQKTNASATSDMGPHLANFSQPDLLTSQTAGPDLRFWLALFLIPPGILGVFFLIRISADWTPQSGGRSALAQIKRATTTQDVSKALLRLIAGKFGTPDNLTRSEAVSAISGQVNSTTVTDLDALLGDCERAMFTGDDSISFVEIKRQARLTTNQLSRIRGIGTEYPEIKQPRRLVAMLALMAILLTVTGYSLFSVFQNENGGVDVQANGWVQAIELNDIQKATLLEEATTEYERGLAIKSTDAAESKTALTNAAQKYQVLVESGVENSELYFNLGNAYLQNDSIGRAVANYQRASKLRPLDSRIHRNLEFAQSRVENQNQSKRSTSILTLASFKTWLIGMPSLVWLTLLAIGWVGGCLCIWFQSFGTGIKLRYVAIPAVALVLAAAGMISWSTNSPRQLPMAVIVAADVPVYIGNSEAFPEVPNLEMNEGEQVKIIQRRGDWLHIQSADGNQGWAKAELLELV